MGDRKCAFEECNALEFRNSEYCLRHTDITEDDTISDYSNSPWKFNWHRVGIILFIMYIPIPILFYYMMMLPDVQPGGAIAPVGLLDIPSFICSLFPILFWVFWLFREKIFPTTYIQFKDN